jgi:hypothetical protein
MTLFEPSTRLVHKIVEASPSFAREMQAHQAFQAGRGGTLTQLIDGATSGGVNLTR